MRPHAPVRVALVLAACACAALVLPAAGRADPPPTIAQTWPACGVPPDDDGRYCVISQTQNGVPIVRPGSGTFEEPYVDLIGPGDVRFGVFETDVDAASQTGDVPPGDLYELVVNTGSIRPRELFGNIRNVGFSRGGSAAGGYTFTLSFRPTPVAWRLFSGTCVVGACGDATTVADLLYGGFVTGYVTDLASSGLGAAEIALRTGFVHAYSAQDASTPHYDPATNSLVVRMANPHLRTPGVPATGSYETFMPSAMLTGLLEVPDPSSLTGGSFVVSRSLGGAVTPVAFTLTHTPDGIGIDIPSITFSSPTYRIRPKKTPPGPPRLRSASRVSRTSVRLRFRAPLANGGSAVTRYVARCRRPGGKWFTASRRVAPITVRHLPRRPMKCSVRAVNALGKGKFSAEKTA